MTQNAQPPTTRPTLRHWATAACLVAGTLLTSCGGQSSGTNTVAGDSQNSGGNSNTASLAMAGAYKGTATGNSSEFVSFVTPSQQLYVLYALQINDTFVYPIIYTGSLRTASATSATVAEVKAFQFQNSLRLGTATVTGTSAAAHTVALANLYISTLTASPQFNAASIATTANAQGVWTGTWADGLDGSIGINASVTLSGTTPEASTAVTGFGNCTRMNLTLTPASDATTSPYFVARVVISATTNCRWTPVDPTTTLTGIGFIHESPVSGKTKRLELILTDTTGSGISFRGDQ